MARSRFVNLLTKAITSMAALGDIAATRERANKALEVAMATKAEVIALRAHLGAIVVVTTLLGEKFSTLTKQVADAQANDEPTDDILAEMDETAAKLRAISMTNATGTNPDGTPAEPAPLPDSPPDLTPGDTADPALITGAPTEATATPVGTSETPSEPEATEEAAESEKDAE